MPCDSRINMTVEFNQNTRVDLLAKALIAQGYKVTNQTEKTLAFRKGDVRGTFQNDKMNIDQSGYAAAVDVNAIKRSYSQEVINFVAQQRGWTVKQNSPTQFVAMKRSF